MIEIISRIVPIKSAHIMDGGTQVISAFDGQNLNGDFILYIEFKLLTVVVKARQKTSYRKL